MTRLRWILALLFGALAALATPALRGDWLETDLTRLLPPSDISIARAVAAKKVTQGFERRYAVLLEGADEAALFRAAREITALARANSHVEVSVADASGFEALGRYYFERRDRLLAADAVASVEAGDTEALKDAALRRLYGPGGAAYARSVEADPFLLFPAFISRIQGGDAGFSPRDGFLYRVTDKGHAILLDWTLTSSPFGFETQAALTPLLADVRAKAAAAEVKVTTAGVLDHAVVGTETGRGEMQSFGFASLGLILLMVLYAFRRPAAVVQISVVLAGSIGAGFLAAVALFGEMHAIALVASTSLIGSSVDYGIHFLSHRFRGGEWSPDAAAAAIRRPMTLGMITSEMGFAGLYLTGFPVLQQIAVFSGAGLLAAYAISLVWLPAIVTSAPGDRPERLIRLADRLFRDRFRHRLAPLAVILIGLGLAAFGWRAGMQPDDIRLLQQPTPALDAAEAHLRDISGPGYGAQFLLVTGRDAEEVLTRETAIRAGLADLATKGAIGGAVMLADFVPTDADQTRSLAAARKLYAPDSSAWSELKETLGLAGGHVAADRPVRLDAVLPLLPKAAADLLWLGKAGDGVAAVVPLKAPKNLAAVKALADRADGVYFVDQVGEISATLSGYKIRAAWFVAGSYGLMFALFLALFGPRRALALIAPATVAAGAVLGGFTAFGLGIDLFGLIGLMLVLGFGVDYALYLHFDAETSDSATNVAILLSTVSTQLAFGMLAFSHVPALRSFGLCVGAGMLVAYLFAPVARCHAPLGEQ